ARDVPRVPHAVAGIALHEGRLQTLEPRGVAGLAVERRDEHAGRIIGRAAATWAELPPGGRSMVRAMHAPPGDRAAADAELLERARALGAGATLRAYLRLSGPGWLQSAITLGGGSL